MCQEAYFLSHRTRTWIALIKFWRRACKRRRCPRFVTQVSSLFVSTNSYTTVLLFLTTGVERTDILSHHKLRPPKDPLLNRWPHNGVWARAFSTRRAHVCGEWWAVFVQFLSIATQTAFLYTAMAILLSQTIRVWYRQTDEAAFPGASFRRGS